MRCPNCGEWNDMHGCIVNDRGNICYNRPFNLFNHNRELQQQLATITQERDALKRIIDDTLREVPVGNVNAHIPENLPMDMEYYVQETVKQDFEIERLEKERDAPLPQPPERSA